MFPSKIVLVDTGERRHPHSGEYYIHDGGKDEVLGPFMEDEADLIEEDEWMYSGDHYAIYKLEVEGEW